MGLLTYIDHFTVGIGMDLAGAYLVARGLRRDPVSLYSRTTWGGGVEGQLIDEARDRAWSDVGVPALLIGFLAQAAGYALSISVRTDLPLSVEAGLVAFAFAPVTALLVLALEKATHERRANRLLVAAATVESTAGGYRDEPNWEYLARIAAWKTKTSKVDRAHLSDEEFCRAVFRIK